MFDFIEITGNSETKLIPKFEVFSLSFVLLISSIIKFNSMPIYSYKVFNRCLTLNPRSVGI